MSGLIKGTQRHRPAMLQAIGATPSAAGTRTARDAELEALTSALVAAQAKIESQAKAFDRLAEEGRQAANAAEARGIDAGRKQAADQSNARLGALEEGISAVQSLVAQEMVALEQLALEIARQALEQVLGDGTRTNEIVAAAIRTQLANLDTQSILKVEVSAADFPSEETIAELAVQLGAPAVTITARADMEAGDCRIRLSLGTLDVGPRQQWRNLVALLNDMSGADFK